MGQSLTHFQLRATLDVKKIFFVNVLKRINNFIFYYENAFTVTVDTAIEFPFFILFIHEIGIIKTETSI